MIGKPDTPHYYFLENIGLKTFLSAFILITLLFSSSYAQDEEDQQTGTSRDTNKTLIQEVKDYSEQDGFFSKLIRNILVTEDEETKSDPSSAEKINRKYTGRIIRNIDINVLDVFGTSVDHPLDTATNWLQKAGNAVHISTKAWLIRDKLLFYPGARLYPFDLQESERILRQNPYIYDARIIARRIKGDKDSIDVVVFVQDIWSITGGASYRPGSKAGSLSFKDSNFLGFGNEFTGGIKFDDDLHKGWDWDGSYSFNNIDRTYLTARVYYQAEKDIKQYGFGVNRDFFSPVIRWAGGLSFDWQQNRQSLLQDTLRITSNLRFNQQDYWLGYAFDLKPFDPNTVNQNRFNIAFRITRTNYDQRPDYDTFNLFQNNTFYLGRLGFSLKSYYQDRYIFGLGKTEDIPVGTIAELLIGIEKGQYADRPYLGFKSGHSLYSDHLGYLYGGFQIGAFKYNDNFINGTTVLEFLYFSKLLPIGHWQWRHYLGSRYSHSHDPVAQQEILDLNNENGLRGFNDNFLRGNKKLTLNYETNYFVPLKFLGFKLAFITFADFALLSPTNNSLLNSKLYSGYGIGLRIRNEHLIFPTFQLMIGYYPNVPQPGGERINVFKQTSMFYHFNQFQFSRPSPVTF